MIRCNKMHKYSFAIIYICHQYKRIQNINGSFHSYKTLIYYMTTFLFLLRTLFITVVFLFSLSLSPLFYYMALVRAMMNCFIAATLFRKKRAIYEEIKSLYLFMQIEERKMSIYFILKMIGKSP